MPEHSTIVEECVAAVRRRRNLHRLWTTLIWAATIGATLSIVVGLGYVLQGYAVPGVWIGSILAVVSFVAVILWALRRLSIEQAAIFTDRFFVLHDTVTSYLHFASQGRRDGYYALQSQQTVEQVAKLDRSMIRYQPPRRLLCLALGLLGLTIPISLFPTSVDVLDRLATEQAVEKETAAINERLLKETNELIEETKDTEEEPLLDSDELRRFVDELKTTTDRTEALRQYARLDSKLNDVRASLQRKDDEQLLDRAAEELAKGDDTESMADSLMEKEYAKAAEKLKELKPSKSKSPDKQRRDLGRLKAIAQRMAMAAYNAPNNKSGKEDGTASDGGLTEKIDQLADACEKLGKADLSEDKLTACQKKLCDKVDDLADQLKKLAMCQHADSRLSKLCQSCGDCQTKVACASPNAGGKKAGFGSDTARRNEQDALVDNGQTTELQGIKGAGPSDTTIEAAESGSGVSTRRATVRQREFKHQFESFVGREDVPEAVRDGVKQYFQIIHEVDTETSSRGDPKE